MTKEPISNEIITLFYVIYGDGIPIYDTYNYRVSPIVTLSEDGVLIDSWYNFQINKINKYAKED